MCVLSQTVPLSQHFCTQWLTKQQQLCKMLIIMHWGFIGTHPAVKSGTNTLFCARDECWCVMFNCHGEVMLSFLPSSLSSPVLLLYTHRVFWLCNVNALSVLCALTLSSKPLMNPLLNVAIPN